MSWNIRLEPITEISICMTLKNTELYQIISCLEKHALDERIIGKNDNARRIARLIMKIEEQIDKNPLVN